MRKIKPLYLIPLLVWLAPAMAYAGEVWVVKPRPVKSVWVVQKRTEPANGTGIAQKPSNNLSVPVRNTERFSDKSCPCSSQCVCGCNAGKPCNCNQLSGNSGQLKVAPSIGSATFTSSAICLPGG